jgi:septum formation protein
VLVLASSSLYRRSLLERLRVPFEVVAPAIDESALADERPRETALRLAEAKARAIIAGRPGDVVVIGSDQVADLAGTLLGKPGGRDAALAQLLAMRGRTVVFHTAVCVMGGSPARVQVEEVPTTVRMRHFSEAQALHYLAIDAPYDCAGSARIESLGIALVERVVSDDPTALIGLPLIALVGMLLRAGVEIL